MRNWGVMQLRMWMTAEYWLDEARVISMSSPTEMNWLVLRHKVRNIRHTPMPQIHIDFRHLIHKEVRH